MENFQHHSTHRDYGKFSVTFIANFTVLNLKQATFLRMSHGLEEAGNWVKGEVTGDGSGDVTEVVIPLNCEFDDRPTV